VNHPNGRPVSVYALKDPDGAVRYIGWSIYPQKRLLTHIRVAKSGREVNHRTNWILSLAAKGLTPTLDVIEENVIDFSRRERFWIAYFRSLGARLTNGTEGGEGMLGHRMSGRTKKALSEAWKRKPTPPPPPPSEETKQIIRESNRRRIWTPEQRAALSAARRGKKHHWTSRKGRKPCVVCGLPQNAKGLCGKHYQQAKRDQAAHA